MITTEIMELGNPDRVGAVSWSRERGVVVEAGTLTTAQVAALRDVLTATRLDLRVTPGEDGATDGTRLAPFDPTTGRDAFLHALGILPGEAGLVEVFSSRRESDNANRAG